MRKKGEINRLNKLLHLGVIQNQFPGMRHTRLDYTMTMLYLTHRLKEARLEGLSPESKVGSIRLSGRDTLQILALISNIGHLPGTFAVEKGVMRFIVGNNLRDTLIEQAELDNDIQIDYLNLNKVLALVKLKKWRKDYEGSARGREIFDAAIILLSELITQPGTEHRRKVFGYFNLVRRVSYQLVDCIYVNLPIKIEYANFIDQLPVSSQNVLALIDQYTRIVYTQIYHAENACKQAALWTEAVYESLSKKVRDPKSVLKKVFMWLEKALLEDLKINPQDNQGLDRVLTVTIPHAFYTKFLTESFVTMCVDSLELNLADFLRSAKTTMLYIPGLRDPVMGETSAGELRFNVFMTDNSSKEDHLKILGKTLVWCYRNFGSSYGIGILVKAAFQAILQTASGKGNDEVLLDIAPDDFFKSDDFVLNLLPEDRLNMFGASRLHKKNALKLFKSGANKEWPRPKRERFFECKALRELTKKVWEISRPGLARFHVIIPAQIKVKEVSNNRDICEFDGALMRLSVRGKNISKITLFLLEAKSGKKASGGKAKGELQKKLKRLNEFSVKVKYRKLGNRTKSAYAIVDLF